jgi:hypothetical protein
MYSYYYEVGTYISKYANFEFIHFMTRKWLSKEKNYNQLWMKVCWIAFDGQKHEKYTLQAQNDIGLSEIGTFLYWIIRYKYKGIYKKWLGVLIWYWNNRIIGLSSIGLNEMYCISKQTNLVNFVCTSASRVQVLYLQYSIGEKTSYTTSTIIISMHLNKICLKMCEPKLNCLCYHLADSSHQPCI